MKNCEIGLFGRTSVPASRLSGTPSPEAARGDARPRDLLGAPAPYLQLAALPRRAEEFAHEGAHADFEEVAPSTREPEWKSQQ